MGKAKLVDPRLSHIQHPQKSKHKNMDRSKNIGRVMVMAIATSYFLVSACGLVLTMLTVIQHSSNVNSYCANWLENIFGSFICSSELSFKLIFVTATVIASIGLVSSAQLLRGAIFNRSKNDMLPWIISNGCLIVVAITLLVQQTAMKYIQQDEPELMNLPWFTMLWSLDCVSFAAVVNEYRSSGPKNQEQYKSNLKHFVQVEQLPI